MRSSAPSTRPNPPLNLKSSRSPAAKTRSPPLTPPSPARPSPRKVPHVAGRAYLRAGTAHRLFSRARAREHPPHCRPSPPTTGRIPRCTDDLAQNHHPPPPSYPDFPHPLAAQSRLTLSKRSRFAFAGGFTAYAKPIKSGQRGEEAAPSDSIKFKRVRDLAVNPVPSSLSTYLRTHGLATNTGNPYSHA